MTTSWLAVSGVSGAARCNQEQTDPRSASQPEEQVQRRAERRQCLAREHNGHGPVADGVALGEHHPINNRTLRTQIIAVPAVAVNRSGRRTLRVPTRWPWQDDFTTMLENLRALPGPAG